MHKKKTPQSVFHWCWWLNSHVLFLSTLQSVPPGPDVLTTVLLLWQNNTSRFVSGACREKSTGPCPTIVCSPLAPSALWRMSPQLFSLCSVKIPGLAAHRKLTLRNLLLFLWIKIWFMVYPLKVMELWLHKELYHQHFLVFSRSIWSPDTLLTLEQYFSLSATVFSRHF